MLGMPVACNLKVEKALGTSFPPNQESLLLIEPTIATCTTMSHAPFDFQSVVPRFGNAAHDGAVPTISVSSFRENARAAFEVCLFRATNSCSANVGLNHEVLHALRSLTQCDVVQYGMKLLGLSRTLGVHGNSSVFPQYAEVKGVEHTLNHDEGRFRCRRGQLLEVTEQQNVKLAESIAAPLLGPLRVVNHGKSLFHCFPAIDVDHRHLETCTRHY